MSSRPRLRIAFARLVGSAIHALAITAIAFGHLAYAAAPRAAETPAAEAAPEAEDLEELVGPIALYPDELLAIALPASTYPLEIVQAARFLEKHEKDPELQPDEAWDPSVLGLLNYPEVIQLMNDDLNWTWKLGEAVANQQEEVMDAVQSFRAKVDEAGNLESNEQVTVVKEAEEESPFGPLVKGAEAYLDTLQPGDPLRGYYFKILTRQGPNPPGRAYDYVINGNMIAGFALVAYPADYGNTGIMTFVVNQRGVVQQKDRGPFEGMDAYDPDDTWTVVEADEG